MKSPRVKSNYCKFLRMFPISRLHYLRTDEGDRKVPLMVETIKAVPLTARRREDCLEQRKLWGCIFSLWDFNRIDPLIWYLMGFAQSFRTFRKPLVYETLRFRLGILVSLHLSMRLSGGAQSSGLLLSMCNQAIIFILAARTISMFWFFLWGEIMKIKINFKLVRS